MLRSTRFLLLSWVWTSLSLMCKICQVEDSLPTLEELFQAVPPSCGFDIEIKMTSGPEVEKTPPEEVERVVSAIWRDVSQFLTACQEGSGCVQRQVLLSKEHVVPTAKALGIGIMTYGLENDDDAAIVKQKALELDGVIVDNVQALLAE
ncbi:hypothetical protein CEUSTIGMA_g13759.t1 [Chlamydomonas eustigma]|uniref:Glycerophosphodiester phosphodiesterase n=1 Tax=Chlamydomonas eustigma TaxID=1157962 RepID=A0A250XTF0_9CHLO|nr:hypothetical protein CEUSTIGMA_g13759.t1 [Chlamydomonas eustigma]|eukprot:GAX86347.1 hypothetical protein CEUSTIGMA_g13759.t1 [Chlamydomonas eustigma]